jgi:hypothetical protein
MRQKASREKGIQNSTLIMLLVLPWLLFVGTAICQTLVSLTLSRSSVSDDGLSQTTNPLVIVINIISIIIGVIAVVLLILYPLWITLLVRNNAGKPKKKVLAVVLAIAFGFFAWLYTYEKDSTKFWLNFSLSLVTFGGWSGIAWLWSVIDIAARPDTYYTHYYAHIGQEDQTQAK